MILVPINTAAIYIKVTSQSTRPNIIGGCPSLSCMCVTCLFIFSLSLKIIRNAIFIQIEVHYTLHSIAFSLFSYITVRMAPLCFQSSNRIRSARSDNCSKTQDSYSFIVTLSLVSMVTTNLRPFPYHCRRFRVSNGTFSLFR